MDRANLPSGREALGHPLVGIQRDSVAVRAGSLPQEDPEDLLAVVAPEPTWWAAGVPPWAALSALARAASTIEERAAVRRCCTGSSSSPAPGDGRLGKVASLAGS